MIQSRKESIIGHAFLIIASLMAIYPLLAIIGQALTPSPGSEATGLTMENFIRAWTHGGFDSSLISSALVALAVIAITGVVGTMAGYAIAVLELRWRGPILLILLIGFVLPSEARIIPLYHLITDMGLLNTHWALILPQVASSFSITTFWMANFFAALPRSLAESASLDGANSWKTLQHIYWPLGMSALGTLSCLVFLFTWNEFMLALVLIPDDPSVQTAPLSLSFFAGAQRNVEPQVIAAAAVLVALPVLIAYIFLQRRFMSGLLEGAVKG